MDMQVSGGHVARRTGCLITQYVRPGRPGPRPVKAMTSALYNGDQPRADRCHRRESGDNGPGQLSP